VKVLSLFSGIGGLDLACEAAGMEIVAFSEIEPYACEILKKRWSQVANLGDVRNITGDLLGNAGIGEKEIDVVVGGFPCQPFSVIGRRQGKEDFRFLWPEFARVVQEVRPVWVVAENVPGILDLAIDDVLSDLESQGYSAGAFVYPASAVGAPHRRERVFVVAYSESERRERMWSLRKQEPEKHVQKEKINWICGRSGKFSGRMWRTPDAHCDRGSCSDGKMQSKLSNKLPISINDQVRHSGNRGSLNPDWVECLMGFPIGWTDVSCEEPLPWPGWPAPAFEDQFEYEPPTPAENVRNRAKRLRCLGNAVVPQQAYPIFRSIVESEGSAEKSRSGDDLK